MDEGDEDRQAGIDDDDEGSDLDLGDQPDDTGQILRIQDLKNTELWEEKFSNSAFCFVLEIIVQHSISTFFR